MLALTSIYRQVFLYPLLKSHLSPDRHTEATFIGSVFYYPDLPYPQPPCSHTAAAFVGGGF
jgi:hypothetical protein